MDRSLEPALLAHLHEKGFSGCKIDFWSICNKPSDMITFSGYLKDPWLLIERLAPADDLTLLKPLFAVPEDEQASEIRIATSWSEKDPAPTEITIKHRSDRVAPTGHEAISKVRQRDALTRLKTALRNDALMTRGELILIARDIVCH